MEAMTESKDANAPPPAMPDAQLVEALRNASPLFGSTHATIKLGAIAFRDTTGKEEFNLPAGTFTFSAEGFDQPVGRITLSFNHSGLVVNDIPPTEQDLLPRELALNIALESLPVAELWKGATDTLSSADLSSDQGSGMAMMMFMGLLQQALVNGKAHVDITDSHIGLALARAQFSGAIEASGESAFGAAGKMTVDVTGLDALIAAVTNHGGPQADEVSTLELARGFSNRQTAADGTVTDHYDLVFTPQGQFLVNGKEFNFMGSAGGESPPPDGTAPAPDASAPPADGTTGAPQPADGSSGDTTSGSN
jgi:hypothetical protein